MSDEKFNNPFERLKALREQLPRAEERAAKAFSIPRAVVRLEKKGRGGKEVTVIEQLSLPAPQMTEWIKALKSSLGCGGSIEDGALVLQGDHRERVKAWLEEKGVKRVSVG